MLRIKEFSPKRIVFTDGEHDYVREITSGSYDISTVEDILEWPERYDQLQEELKKHEHYM